MLKLDYKVKLLAPVVFAEKSGDNVLYATKRYIPGSAIRGAVANLLINEMNLGKDAHLDENFYNIILSGKLKFLPCYYADGKLTSIPAPLSLMAHKDGKHFKDYSCDSKLEAGYKKLSGFINVDSKNGSFVKLNPNIQIEFHMSRGAEQERITGSSRDGAVFNYEYLEPYQEFAGSIIAKNEDKLLLEKVLAMLDGAALHLGRSKSAQYGTGSVAVGSLQELETASAANKLYLYALTPYIMNDYAGRIDTELKLLADKLSHKLGCEVKVAEGMQFVNTEYIDGYVGVWNVKRERKIAIAAGSLVKFELTREIPDENNLAEALYYGFGERTEDGFGQFRVWKPLEHVQEEKLLKAGKELLEIPAEVRKRAKAILREKLLIEVRKQAQLDALGKGSEKAKGTLKRIELLMEGCSSKFEIQENIREFKAAAVENLRAIKINGYALNEVLLEENDAKAPYCNINWALDKLEFTVQQKQKLESALGKDALRLDEDTLYREYWLWFMRHSAKKVKSTQEYSKAANSLGAKARIEGGK